MVAAQAFLTLIVYQDRREAGPGQSKKNQKKINPTAGIVYMLRMVIRTGRLENSWSWRSGIEDDAVFSLSASRAVEAKSSSSHTSASGAAEGNRQKRRDFFLFFFFLLWQVGTGFVLSPRPKEFLCFSLCRGLVWDVGQWSDRFQCASLYIYIFSFLYSPLRPPPLARVSRGVVHRLFRVGDCLLPSLEFCLYR